MSKKIRKIHTPRVAAPKFAQRDLDRMAHSLVERGLASKMILDRTTAIPGQRNRNNYMKEGK